jgi:hypothetical protein
MIEDFGGRIATVWSELRPATRGLVERALQAATSGAAPNRNFQYDARADLELSRFLAALDDRASEKKDGLDAEQVTRLRSVADTCAGVLQEVARSEDVLVRELANEALARFPISVLASLLSDPVDSEIARGALRRQVVEYGSEEARQLLMVLDQTDEL